VNTENIVVHNLQHKFNYKHNTTLSLHPAPSPWQNISSVPDGENHNFTVPGWLPSHL